MFSDKNDYPLPLPRRAVRSILFRTGLQRRLGEAFWEKTDDAPYIHEVRGVVIEQFAHMPTSFDDPIYNAMIGADSARWSLYRERQVRVEECFVEPNRCMVIGKDGKIVRQSIPHPALPMYPNAISHILKSEGDKVREAILYDGFSSKNYYHHLVDCLTNLAFLIQRTDLSRELPLIINRWIFESRFFSYLRERNPEFAKFNWLVQEPGRWFHVERLHLLRAAPFQRDYWHWLRALYLPLSSGKRTRVFLSRDRRLYSRGIGNEAEVIDMLKRYGFTTVYAEHLAVEDQQRVFEEAECLVALQGMGLAQQFLMDWSNARILEIMPNGRLQSEYYWQGWTLGVRYYDVQVGGSMDQSGSYYVDVDRLEQGVQKLLESPSNVRQYGRVNLLDSRAKTEPASA